MSASLDYSYGGEDLYTGGGVGYSPDGTFTTPGVAITALPADAGGGPVGTYGKDVMDLFKFGVGVWNQREQRQDMLDYKRFEATQYGAFMQGQPALTFSSGGNVLGGASGMVLVALAAVVILLIKD